MEREEKGEKREIKAENNRECKFSMNSEIINNHNLLKRNRRKKKRQGRKVRERAKS